MIEPLFILNYETGEFVPWLATSFTANETLDTWTLTLRDGVKWSDGEAFNADDVVFTINMLLVPDNVTMANAADMQTWVESVSKVDDLTVEFKLKNSNPRFQLDYFSVRIWGGVNIAPEHIWSGQDPLTFTNYDPEQGWPVYTGPYTLTSVSETEFIYDRNENWWGAESGFMELPAPRRLIWNWAGPEEARAALMAENGLDSIMDITLGTFLAMQEQNPNVHAWLNDLPYATLDPCSRVFAFNNAKAPWDTADMRQAVNRAIDREQIVAIAYEGTTVPSRSFFPAYAPLNRYTDMLDYEAHPVWNYNPDEAKAMIESLGYTMGGDGYYAMDGTQLAMDITTHDAFIEKQRIAAVLVEQFQAVGINASTRNEAENNYTSAWTWWQSTHLVIHGIQPAGGA
jgi:peptide/nickel transport system substrate-binding protein